MKSFKHHITEVYKDSGLGKWFGKGGEGGTTKGGWDRYNSSGEKVGKCGDAEEGDAYAACLSAKKAAKLGKKGIASFVRRKRAAQNKAGRGDKGDGSSGKKPINVKTGITDKDPKKKGIQDSHMKSFKNYIEEENKPTNPELWSQAKSKARAIQNYGLVQKQRLSLSLMCIHLHMQMDGLLSGTNQKVVDGKKLNQLRKTSNRI